MMAAAGGAAGKPVLQRQPRREQRAGSEARARRTTLALTGRPMRRSISRDTEQAST